MVAISSTKPINNDPLDPRSQESMQGRSSFAQETTQESAGSCHWCLLGSGSCRLKAHKAIATVMVSLIDLLDRISRHIDSSPTILRDQVRDEFRQFEAELIKIALIHTGGTKDEAAHLLNMPISQMTGKMRIHDIDHESIALRLAYLINGD